MRISRVFIDQPLTAGTEVDLPRASAHYLCQVLRLKASAPLVLFNGDGHDYPATLITADKRQARVHITACRDTDTESPLKVHLGLGLSRGERMDYALQKSTELGVCEITPLFTEHSEVRLSPDRLPKRMTHWQQVIISACEQCGRASLPALHDPQSLQEWIEQPREGQQLVLDQQADTTLTEMTNTDRVSILIGPEGGFSDAELNQARQAGFTGIRLGSRILRTETAPVAALAVLQYLWGDLRDNG